MCFYFHTHNHFFRKKSLLFSSFQRVYISCSDRKSLPCDAHERKTLQQTTNLLEALPQMQTKLKVNPQNLEYFSAKFPLHLLHYKAAAS